MCLWFIFKPQIIEDESLNVAQVKSFRVYYSSSEIFTQNFKGRFHSVQLYLVPQKLYYKLLHQFTIECLRWVNKIITHCMRIRMPQILLRYSKCIQKSICVFLISLCLCLRFAFRVQCVMCNVHQQQQNTFRLWTRLLFQSKEDIILWVTRFLYIVKMQGMFA